MNMNEEMGRRIKLAREKLHLSQEYISSLIGMNRSSFVLLESGKRKITAEELAKISGIIGLTTEEIIHGRDITTENATVFARKFNELTERDQNEIMNMIEFKKAMREKIG